MLVRQRGRSSARDWLRAALGQRVEIERADAAGLFEDSVPDAASWQPAFAGLDHPAEALMAEPLRARLRAFAGQLGGGNATLQKAATALEQALQAGGGADPVQRLEAAWAALHTKADTPRKLWRGEAPAAFDAACADLAAIREAMAQQEAHEEHRRLVRLSRALLQCYRDLKIDEGLADMADLEVGAERLLADAELSGWLQERLDTRLTHLLIDEFQDTNPTQWRALHAWLAGYAGAGGGASGQRPLSVFLVGDPKQSIYRFRRADPRVFGAARGFVEQALGGRHLSCDHTRRNAPAVIETLNAVFGRLQSEGSFDGFRDHTTASDAQGAVRRLPAVPRPGSAGPETRVATSLTASASATATASASATIAVPWRDSLTTPRREPEEALRLLEARRVAQEIARCLAGADGLPACEPGDVFVLARKRAPLLHVAQALRDLGIPFSTPAEQALADLPEVRDVIALLDALVSPRHDLSLAHALRSPVFGADDGDLQALALAVREGRSAAAAVRSVATATAGDRSLVPQLAGDPSGDVGWWPALMGGAGAGRPALDRARRLLPGWADAARSLPPHDLLDRIFHEGDLPARTAAAVPPTQRAQALATLDALVGQALELDGGRYATPYRFIRALRRRPLTLPASVASQAVQLMTVHGAKGLEADAVFLVDGLPEPTKAGSATLLVDWPADAPHPLRCAFLASETRCPPSLRELLAQERVGREREELNGLYVAMTRAKRRLVVSATEPHGSAMQPGPWQRLAAAGVVEQAPVPACDAAESAIAAGVTVEVAELPRWQTAPEGGSTGADGAGRDAGGNHAAETEGGPGRGLVEDATRLASADRTASIGIGIGIGTGTGTGTDDSDASRLGRAVHRVLEWLPAPGRLDAACAVAATAFGLAAGRGTEVRRLVGRILDSPTCRPFFDPQAFDWAANELPLTWQGEVLRLDRLVRRRGSDGRAQWWVLDHKLQQAPQAVASNLAQLGRYREAVRALNPEDDVQAAFITGAGELVILPP
jgi:ATP-dependent helicase/nuclease subunit A